MLTSSRRLKDRAILDAPTPRNDVVRTFFARMCSLWPMAIESPFGRIDRNRPACGEVVQQSDKPESALSEIRVPVRSILAKLCPGSVCLDPRPGSAAVIFSKRCRPQSRGKQPFGRAQRDSVRRLLGALPQRNLQVLNRYYVMKQEEAQICVELQLPSSEFHRIKSEARARFDTSIQR